MMNVIEEFSPIRWCEGALRLLDQRVLPAEENWLSYTTPSEVADAIAQMVVRGAPAIGITAAYGMVLSVQQAVAQGVWMEALQADRECLAASRPTAVNLFWALDRMMGLLAGLNPQQDDVVACALREAQQIHEEDVRANRQMGAYGAERIAQQLEGGESCGLLTHCNTGALATGGYGTALGVLRSAYAQGWVARIYADETRPWLQGARLTAWELLRSGLPVTLNADAAAATLMAQGKVRWVVVGADRIAANGDVANKIGTYSLAVLARHHGVRFMVAAPLSTFDLDVSSGQDIPIETRGAEELLRWGGQPVAPERCDTYNPVFDVTPAALIDCIVTERGVIDCPSLEQVQAHFRQV